MDAYLNKTTYAVREFDDDLVRRLLQSVRVINEEKVEIQFKSGIVMQQRIAYYE
jgi:site-specific DNA recombinase